MTHTDAEIDEIIARHRDTAFWSGFNACAVIYSLVVLAVIAAVMSIFDVRIE